MPFTVDRSPHKQGLYLPGRVFRFVRGVSCQARPDYVFILPGTYAVDHDQMAVVELGRPLRHAPFPSS